MTTDRPEIVIEGSDDGVEWREYRLPLQAAATPARAAHGCAPHQPRLDWQMWFAALGAAAAVVRRAPRARCSKARRTCSRSSTNNPFPDRPPRYVRALLYNYQMTDPGRAGGPARGGAASSSEPTFHRRRSALRLAGALSRH